jgi:hypothetical protein
MNTAVVTIVSKNYLCYARTLMQSVTRAHPEWRQYVLLVDEIRGELDPAKEKFQVVELAKLPLPHRKKFCFRYSIVEMNTAVKPWMFEWLFEHEGFDRVVYIDPDIYVYSRLTDMESKLDAGALMVLTPHLTGMLDDDGFPTELALLRTGTFNLGFIALSRHPSLSRFLKWWQDKLEYTCILAPDAGIFFDQRWMEFAPGMFEDVAILRHDGYNVSYWNIYQRHVTIQGNDYLVNGKPLVFWHFSGKDPKAPAQLSKNHDRVALAEREPVKTIARDFAARVAENGQETCSRMAYAFGSFANGERIPYWIREAYRNDQAFQRAAGDDPFSTAIQYLNRPFGEDAQADEPLTNAMQYYWRFRPDLQASFPKLSEYKDRHRFLEWLVWVATREWHGTTDTIFPAACVPSLQPSFRAYPGFEEALKVMVDPANYGPFDLGALMHGDHARFLVGAYNATLKRNPDPSGFTSFLADLRNGVSRIEVLYALRYSNDGRKFAATIPGLLPRYILEKVRRRGRRMKKYITGQ